MVRGKEMSCVPVGSYVTSNLLVCQRDHLGQRFLGDQVVPVWRKKKRRDERERKRREVREEEEG